LSQEESVYFTAFGEHVIGKSEEVRYRAIIGTTIQINEFTQPQIHFHRIAGIWNGLRFEEQTRKEQRFHFTLKRWTMQAATL
jgi:hypothetical protein